MGNEALFTNKLNPYIKGNKDVLLGMDILRIALERSKTAKEALDISVHFFSNYNQGDNSANNNVIIRWKL
jgi:secernin